MTGYNNERLFGKVREGSSRLKQIKADSGRFGQVRAGSSRFGQVQVHKLLKTKIKHLDLEINKSLIAIVIF